MELLQSLLSNIWAVFLVVFFFGGSIFVHELGHFLAARRRGVVVERFSIGMGPPMFRWTGKDGVEYWISWLPLGGYVKLPQLADLGAIEGGSSSDYSRLPPPTYSTKVMVFAAGAFFNVIFAFLLATILWVIGVPTADDIHTTQIGYVLEKMEVDGVSHQSPAARAGLQAGDTILAVDGRKVEDWIEFKQALVLGAGRTANGEDREVRLQIKRGEEIRDFRLNPILAGDEKLRMIGVSHAHKIVVEKVTPGSPAEKIGFKAHDQLSRMDTTPIYGHDHLRRYLESHSAATVKLEVLRNGGTATLTVPPNTSLEKVLEGIIYKFSVRLTHETPLEQLKKVLQSTVQGISSVINPKSDIGVSKFSGPIGIVMRFWEAATSEYPMRVVMWIAVMINISLAVFNLLPIPVLDGGHIVFATIAKLRGRALPAEFINATQSVFMLLLFSMIIYVSYFDTLRETRRGRSAPPPATQAPAANPEPTTRPASP